MTISLDLPGDLERRLAAEAARLGLTVAEYAVRILSGGRARPPAEILTGADVVAFWEREGVIGSRSDIDDAAEHARRIRAEAERRRGG